MNVIVVDDSELFALHVWRYLSRFVGIGHVKWSQQPLESQDGAVKVWWVRADDNWRTCLQGILSSGASDHGAGGRQLILLDVHGVKGSAYSAVAAYELLADAGVEEDCIWMISAYDDHGSLAGGHEVMPKSRETLKRARKQLPTVKGFASRVAAPGVRHVLVTGAGFEMREEVLGGFGFPATSDLLAAMDLKEAKRQLKTLGEGAFPVLRGGVWGTDSERGKLMGRLERIARKRSLDWYWDFVLKTELDWKMDVGEESEEREGDKLEGVLQENALREAFRKVVRAYDWGHMNQSIDAASRDWSLWLTTNYTQFSDRAIAIAPNDHQHWRIISTAAEARIAVREDRELDTASYRYLVKLHGDVGHLHTMAIAGHDKEVFSPLTVPMEDLSQVYAAAERFVLNLVNDQSVQLVVWHVVGHSLNDRMLRELMVRVVRNLEQKHAFLLVNPKEEPFSLPPIKRALLRTYRSSLKAGAYLARLARVGFPPIPIDKRNTADLTAWGEQALMTLTLTGPAV